MAEPEFMDILSADTIPVEIRELSAEWKYTAGLPFGYELRADSGEYTGDGMFNGIRVFQLVKDGAKVLEISGDVQTVTAGSRAKLFGLFEPYLINAEGAEKTAWMRKKFVRMPEDIAPWERDEPIRNINIPLDEAEQSLNDAGNAARFAEECGGWLVSEVQQTPKGLANTWFAYHYYYWKRAVNEVVVAGLRVAASIPGGEVKQWSMTYEVAKDTRANTQGAKENAYEKRLGAFVGKLADYSQKSNNKPQIYNMIALAGQTSMTDNVTKKSNPHLLALKNGMFDTSKGAFYPLYQCEQFKDQYPMRYIDAAYTPGKISMAFCEALQAIFTDNTTMGLEKSIIQHRSIQMCRYVLRLFGYALLAGNPKQSMVIFTGNSSNGKSLMMDVIKNVIGPDEFGQAMITELASDAGNKPMGQTTTAAGKRILYYSEGAGKDILLSSARLKMLTDRSVIFRKMREDGEDQPNYCLPFVSCNSFPRFDDFDDAVMRRIVVIPCPHKFIDGVDKDETLLDKLTTEEERDAILSMLLDENIAYHHGRPFDEAGCKGCSVPEAERFQRCKECRDRCKPGLLALPEFCKDVAASLITDDKYTYFINTMYEPTDGTAEAGRTVRSDIAALFLEWAHENRTEVDVDRFGELMQKELTGLYNAFKVLGYKELKSHSKRYIFCKRKQKPIK